MRRPATKERKFRKSVPEEDEIESQEREEAECREEQEREGKEEMRAL